MQLEKNLQAPLLRATSEASLLRKARDPPIGPLGRLFFKHKNRRFGDDLELAARSAFVVVLLSIPLMVRENEVPPAVSFLSQHNFYGPTTVLYFIFAIGANLGQTVELVLQGIFGTFLCFANHHLMYYFLGQGVTKESPPSTFWILAAEGAIFIFVTSWLNFATNTVLWCSTVFVWWWMDMLKEETQAVTFAEAVDGKDDLQVQNGTLTKESA